MFPTKMQQGARGRLTEMRPLNLIVLALSALALPSPQAWAWGDAARILGVHLVILNAANATEIESAYASLIAQQITALVIGGDPLFLTRGPQLV
jgi:hypothetical protein